MSLESTIAANLQAVRTRIERAAEAAGHSPDEIRLVAVSKTFSIDHIRAAHAAGQIDFGENRVQEALEKIAVLADSPIRWHLIGHLQTNKARKATVCAFIHSIDRQELIKKLDAAAIEGRTRPQLLIQVDFAGEPTKHGVEPSQVRELIESAVGCQAVRLVGLMVLPPYSDDPEAARPYFQRLARLRDELVESGVDRSLLRELSMGMSHDLEVAVQEGATMVRVGTAIFGKRVLQL